MFASQLQPRAASFRSRILWAVLGWFAAFPVNAQSEATVGNWYFEGIRRKESGDLAGATKVYGKILAKEPTAFAAAYSLAELHALQKEYSQALTYSIRSNQLDRSNLWAWRLTRSLYEESGQMQRALDCVDSLRVHGEKDADVYHEAALQAARLGWVDRAEQFAQEVIRLGGKTPEMEAFRAQLYLPQQPEKSLELFRLALEEFPGHAELEGQYGSLLMQQKRWAEAERIFLGALNRDPADGRASWMLFDLYQQTGRIAEAAESAKRVLAAPNLALDRKVQLVAGLLVRENASPVVDESWSQLVLKAHPDDAKAWTVAADIAQHVGQTGLAAERWRRALALPGGDLWPLHLGLLQADAQLNDAEALIQDARKAQLSYPLQALSYYFEGLGLQKKKDYSAAERVYRSALRFTSNAPELKSEVQLQLGEVLHRAGKSTESNAVFEELLARDTANAEACNNYAYFLSVRGEQLAQAEALALKAIRLSGRNGGKVPYTFWDTLAWVLHKSGKHEAAWAALELCWTLGGSEDPAVQKHREAIRPEQP